MKNLKKLLKGEDRRQILCSARELSILGWEFDGENDYEFFKNNPPFLPEGKVYTSLEQYISDAEVMIIIESSGETKYLSAPSGTDWQNADAFIPTGDDEKTIEDMLKLGY